jgi:predicted aspartyl protease
MGRIRRSVPYFRFTVERHGTLILRSRGGAKITVDTGFSGTIALPEETLTQMGLEFSGVEVFTLADGSNVRLPVYWGRVQVDTQEFDTWFIPGDHLVGMELFEIAAKHLRFNLAKGQVYLEL